MTTPLIRQGEGPLEAMLRRHQERIEREQQLARILRAADATTVDQAAVTNTGKVTLPGDTRRLRGIPAIGYGVTGAIPGTNPDQAR